MKEASIKGLIKFLGFQPEEAKENVFIKYYPTHDNYIIRVNFNNKNIEYGDKITLGDKTTSNFSSSENFVVLECVDRLLEKGYAPGKLTLEIKWDLGRKEKGKLDIYVADKNDNDKCFLMIECKTAGSEYDKEKKNMLAKGGQLFSYFQQDKSAEYLCLYASEFVDNEVIYDNAIVEVIEEFRTASNKNETYTLWNKSFKDNGIFEDWATAYNIKSKALIREKLKQLKQSDSGFIFNRFAEILRHNVISDKPNAFNKMFNLFLCKIEDENRDPEEELDFQWKEGDTHITLQSRLNNLYKEGMRKFLNIDITDFSDNDLEKELMSLNSVSKKHIADMFMKLRLYKNNEFAFKEVFDDASFEENATVVKEVVELLQPYQLRYSHKQQFLGDFFELLLNTGLKQESGQFFTPVPIAKFIVSSIPLQEIIETKLKNREDNFLPYVIDYAAGSGHFLTETMDEIQKTIEELSKKKYKDSVQRKLNSYSLDVYSWAEEFIYGIEKDYRLVKTAKVACFLNGDGLANLIHADGLDSFNKSIEYNKKLKITTDTTKNNHQFDVIVANPPYSVSAFKNTLKHGEESFNLFNRLTDQSSEIECLFVERSKQLLQEGGYAGIVLPIGILENPNIYEESREIILKNFEVIGIAELGSNTFMATNANTVILFLKKINENQWLRIQESIHKFMKNQEDLTCNGIEKAFSTYSKNVYEISLSQYIHLLNGTNSGEIETNELFTEYKKLYEKSNSYKLLIASKEYNKADLIEQEEMIFFGFTKFIKDIESDKLLYFMLSYDKQVVLVKAGEKKTEKEFLGYEFSNRRGHEGMKMFIGADGKHTTKLYDQEELFNPNKVNSYIHNAFLGKKLTEAAIPETLREHVFIRELHDLINFEKLEFNKEISVSSKKKLKIKSKWDLVKIGDYTTVKGGSGFPTEYQGGTNSNDIPFYKVSDMNSPENQFFMSVSNNYVDKDTLINTIKATIFNKDTLIFPKVGRAIDTNKKRLLTIPAAVDNNVMGVSVSNGDLIPKYLFYYFINYITLIDIASNSNPPSINAGDINDIKIPLPPTNIQKDIIKAIEDNKNDIDSIKNQIKLKEAKVQELIENSKTTTKKLDDIIELISGQSPKSEFYNNAGNGLPFYQGKKDFGADYLLEPTTWTTNTTKESIKNDILMSVRAPVGDVNLNPFDLICIGRGLGALRPKDNSVLYKYLYYVLKFNQELIIGKKGLGFDSITRGEILKIKVPMTSTDIQEELIKEIDIIEQEINSLQSEISILEQKEQSIFQSFLD